MIRISKENKYDMVRVVVVAVCFCGLVHWACIFAPQDEDPAVRHSFRSMKWQQMAIQMVWIYVHVTVPYMC